MPELTINGKKQSFKPGQSILQAALDQDVEVPHYCYHPGLSVVANCRICLAEVWQPNAKTGKLEPFPKLVPTCQQLAADGMVVYTDSPKAVANQKSVMEFLLINHPVDCPVCDQAGECHLQDYSYQYGRGQSRFTEAKNKQPKKDIGPNVLLYSDRCIMCTRCVRFTREVTGTNELMVDGRGSTEQIDIFPGMALDNELSGNVVDLCPVGALLDKDFLFQQRVWFLKKTPSIDGITASGDNISVEHNDGQVYRVKPRQNDAVNQWWITDEVRYGWKFVHSEARLTLPAIKGRDAFDPLKPMEAWREAIAAVDGAMSLVRAKQQHLALLVSPMLSCEDAYHLARYALSVDAEALLAVGPVPFHGEDKTFPGGFTIRAEKAPNARGVRRVLEALSGGKPVANAQGFEQAISSGKYGAAIVTGNYPSDWVTPTLTTALKSVGSVVVIDTLTNALTSMATVVLPGAAWVEKAGSFENATGRLQSFEQAIEPVEFAKSESQIALDLGAARGGRVARGYCAVTTRAEMAKVAGLECMASAMHAPEKVETVESDMVMVEL
ncbi:MAG: molybdopterin-dependent oxidoreductase [Limnohabitans sp.]|jgi:NADH-quinone oxidoreductase subunit G|nr:molybdopterin-dependent oxidoreductase [Limnohabitans sp.]